MITITLAQSFFYSIALAILWLTPGPVWVAVLARSISGGFQSSVPLVLGVALGDLLWPIGGANGCLILNFDLFRYINYFSLLGIDNSYFNGVSLGD